MNILIIIASGLISLAIGIPVGMAYRKKVAESKIHGAENEAKRVLDAAKKALIHIQKILPGPPIYKASDTPAILPTPILEPSVIKKLWIGVIPWFLLSFWNKFLNILLKWNWTPPNLIVK